MLNKQLQSSVVHYLICQYCSKKNKKNSFGILEMRGFRICKQYDIMIMIFQIVPKVSNLRLIGLDAKDVKTPLTPCL